MDETIPTSVQPNWQDDYAYDYTEQLTSRGWAWEFVRRNPDFQKDLAAMLSQADRSQPKSGIVIIRLPADTVDLSRWGLLFCKLDPKRRECLLVPAPLSTRSDHCCRTRREFGRNGRARIRQASLRDHCSAHGK